jgi:hypothetical protein
MDKLYVNNFGVVKKVNFFGLYKIQNVYSLLDTYILTLKIKTKKCIHLVSSRNKDGIDDNMKPSIMNLRLVLFFNQQLQRPDKLMDKLKLKFSELFDDIPTILPMVQLAPPDYPVIQLKSTDNTHKCSISKVNIELSFTPKSIEDYKDIENSFYEIIASFVETVIEYNNNMINRVGFVLNYFIPDTDPVTKITDAYINKQIGTTSEISIRFNNREESNSPIINNITYITNANIINSDGNSSGIHIQRDINNQVTNDVLTVEFISTFIKQRSKEFYKSELYKVVT